MKKEFLVESERLIMRLATENDVDEIVDFVVRNRDYLAPYAPIAPDKYYTKENWEKLIVRTREDAENSKALRFFIFKKEDNTRVIGLINYEFIRLYPIYSCIVGYSMDEHEQGKGYITEALSATTKYLFSELNLMRISGGYSPTNPASGHVMQKVGFEEGHIIKKDIMINGRWEDIMYMHLYNDEWVEMKNMK